MKILNDNVLYDFTVQHDTSSFTTNGNNPSSNTDRRLFRVGLAYRKFEHHYRQPVAVSEQYLDVPHTAPDQVSANLLMSRSLSTLGVPSRIRNDLATHFKFRIDTIARRFSHVTGEGVIPISVRLDVKAIPIERATGIRNRMESAMVEDDRRRRVVMQEEEETVPARRSAIDGLEKVVVGISSGGGDGSKGKECAICLEELRDGVEVVKMPCCHFYHSECIVPWLERKHLCPFCRFKMPC